MVDILNAPFPPPYSNGWTYLIPVTSIEANLLFYLLPRLCVLPIMLSVLEYLLPRPSVITFPPPWVPENTLKEVGKRVHLSLNWVSIISSIKYLVN